VEKWAEPKSERAGQVIQTHAHLVKTVFTVYVSSGDKLWDGLRECLSIGFKPLDWQQKKLILPDNDKQLN